MFLYILTITIGFIFFFGLIYLHLKWVRKSRTSAPYRKFSLAVLVSLFVPILGVFVVFISGYIATTEYNAVSGSNEPFSDHPLSIALILLLPIMILVYTFLVWRWDREHRIELQALVSPKIVEKREVIQKQPKTVNREKDLLDFQPERIDFYQVRKSLFEATRTYRLTETGLHITENEKEIRNIPFREMTQIILFYEPSRYASSNYACKITSPSGSYTFNSTNFNGVANFSDFGIHYTPFVKTLVSDAIKQNPTLEIRAGIHAAKYTLHQVLVYGTIALILATFLIFPMPLGGITIILRLAFVIYLGYYSFKMIVHNKPRKIEREDELERMLP